MDENAENRCYQRLSTDIFERKEQITFAILFTLFGVTSSLGNALVLSVIFTRKTLQTPSNLLLANLAFADFSVVILSMPPLFQSMHWNLINPAGCFECVDFKRHSSVSVLTDMSILFIIVRMLV